VTPSEAEQVMVELSAGFPHYRWPDSATALWYRLLAPVGLAEGMAAAWAVITGHEFLTPAAFTAELARLRERRADEHGPNFNRPQLVSAERVTPPDEAKQHIAEIKGQLRAMKGPLVHSLRKAIPDPPDLQEAQA
jgi:hypothetical protein